MGGALRPLRSRLVVKLEGVVYFRRPLAIDATLLGEMFDATINGQATQVLLPRAPEGGPRAWAQLESPNFDHWSLDRLHELDDWIPEPKDPIDRAEWGEVEGSTALVAVVGLRLPDAPTPLPEFDPGPDPEAWARRVVDWCTALVGIAEPLRVPFTRPSYRWLFEDAEAPTTTFLMNLDIPMVGSPYGTLDRAGLQAVLDLASAGQDLDQRRRLLADAHVALIAGDTRSAVLAASSVLEGALWSLVNDELEKLPPGLATYIRGGRFDDGSLGTLLRLGRATLDELAPLLEENLATIRNRVVHREAYTPSPPEAWRFLSLAYPLLDLTAPLPDGLPAPDLPTWSAPY